MNVFLTGSSGFIGSNLLKKLRKHKVYCYKRGEDPSVIAQVRPAVILHAAAELYDESKMFESNVALTHDLLKHSRDIPYEQFIYIGSSAEFGRKDEPIRETDRLAPENMYEATKGAGSLLCAAFKYAHRKPVAIARPFSLYGAGQPSNKLMPAIYDAYANNTKIELSNGVHDWIYINDFTDGLLKMINARTVDDINFGSGIQTTNADVVRVFEKVLNTSIKIRQVPQLRTYDSACWVCDTTHASKYGFTCRYSLEKGITKYVTHRKNSGD